MYYYDAKTRESSWVRPSNANVITQAELEALAAAQRENEGLNVEDTGKTSKTTVSTTVSVTTSTTESSTGTGEVVVGGTVRDSMKTVSSLDSVTSTADNSSASTGYDSMSISHSLHTVLYYLFGDHQVPHYWLGKCHAFYPLSTHIAVK